MVITLIAKPHGVIIMKLSKRTTEFAYSLVSNHAKFDALSDQYVMDIDMVADFDLAKLASYIYIDNPEFATESTGPDNDMYERHMMPALLVYMKHSTDKDARIEFDHAWIKGTTHYAHNVMNDLLEEMLQNYNHDHDEAA